MTNTLIKNDVMKLVYISGKYRGASHNEVYENIQTARRHAVTLWECGYAVICPHLNTQFMEGLCSEKKFLKGDLVILSKCDYIYMLPNWKDSKGARVEYKFAKDHGIKEL